MLLELVKVMCSVCNREGHLQVRGSSARIGHYVGYDGKTRIVEWHRVDGNQFTTVNNGNQLLVIKKPDLDSFHENKSLGRDLNPRPPPYQGEALTGLGHRGIFSPKKNMR